MECDAWTRPLKVTDYSPTSTRPAEHQIISHDNRQFIRVYAQSTIYPRKRNFYIVTLVWRFHYNGRFLVAPYTRRIISRGLPRLTPTQVYFINYHWFLHFGIIIVDCRHFQPLGCIVAAVFWPRRSGSYKLRILRLIWTSSDIFSYNNTLNILMHNICA